MGIFDKLKGEFIDIIEFVDESGNTLVHKFERAGNEIKNGAQLIVRESQVAVLINEGKLADIYKPGRYELTTQNMPILSTLMGWKYGFNSPFKVDVYFVSTKIFTGQKWGTKNPIVLRDPEFGIVRVRAFGSYSFQVIDVEKLIKQFSGTNSSFQVENLEEELKALILTEFTDALGELKIPVLDLAANYKELGTTIGNFLNEELNKIGLKLTRFLIENISLPKEVEEAIDKRGQMNVLGNLDQYTKFQAANAMEKAATSGGEGGTIGAGLGMGLGMGMANMMNQAFAPQSQQAMQSTTPPPLITYYFAINGQQVGPWTIEQVKQAILQNQITLDTLVWKQGLANWVKVSEMPELSNLFGTTSPPPIPPIP